MWADIIVSSPSRYGSTADRRAIVKKVCSPRVMHLFTKRRSNHTLLASGMVFAVNPDSGHSFQQFLANAKGSSTNTTTGNPPPTGVIHDVKVGENNGLTYTPPYVVCTTFSLHLVYVIGALRLIASRVYLIGCENRRSDQIHVRSQEPHRHPIVVRATVQEADWS